MRLREGGVRRYRTVNNRPWCVSTEIRIRFISNNPPDALRYFNTLLSGYRDTSAWYLLREASDLIWNKERIKRLLGKGKLNVQAITIIASKLSFSSYSKKMTWDSVKSLARAFSIRYLSSVTIKTLSKGSCVHEIIRNRYSLYHTSFDWSLLTIERKSQLFLFMANKLQWNLLLRASYFSRCVITHWSQQA